MRPFQLFEALADKGPHADARRTTLVSDSKNALQVRQ